MTLHHHFVHVFIPMLVELLFGSKHFITNCKVMSLVFHLVMIPQLSFVCHIFLTEQAFDSYFFQILMGIFLTPCAVIAKVPLGEPGELVGMTLHRHLAVQ